MRLRDTFSAILLIFLMLISAQRLYSTNWTDGLGTVLVFALLGSIIGLFLGVSRFNRLVTFLLGLGYSLAAIPLITLSNLYIKLVWGDRLTALGNQLSISLNQLVTGQAVPDPTLFLIIAYVGYWFISLGGGYALMRYGKFARAVVPAGIVLVVVQLFDMKQGDRVYILGVYIFFALLLLGRVAYLRKRNLWRESRVWVSSEAITDLNIFVGAAALALVALVWIAPVSGRPITSARIAWQNLTRPWRERQQDLNKTIQSLQNRQPGTAEIYGDSLSLGRQAATSSDIFAEIRAPLTGGAIRYYWRVRSYDLYQNDQWYSNYPYDQPFIPSEGSIAIADPQGVTAEFLITIPNQGLASMITPARPVWTNRFARLTFSPATPDKIDPLMFEATPNIQAGQEYIVHADIYQPAVSQLRLAGVDYPAWVKSNYLQLPPNLPPEISALARQITAGATDPYDQAALITDWLRKNIHYSTTIDTPPSGRDLLSWFLFDTKTGFCNYYATAEVVMLRSLGIPARLVVGYAQGEFEAPNQFTVRDKDAHAWPEVYFPNNGWEEFEPTVSQPVLQRPLTQADVNALGPTPTPLGANGGNSQQPPIPIGGEAAGGAGQSTLVRLTIYFLVALLLVGGLYTAYFFGVFDRLRAYLRRTFDKPTPVVMKNSLENLGLTVPAWLSRWAYLAELSPAERAFNDVYRSLHWLRAKISPADTPAEAAAALSTSMPSAAGEIQALLREYELSLYSQEKVDLAAARRSADVIRSLAWRAAIQARLKAFRVLLTHGFRPKEDSDSP